MNALSRTRQLSLLGVMLTALLAGCTTTVTVVSDPEGAMITNRAGTVKYGYAPVQVEFDKKTLEATRDPADPQGCAQLQGFTATWPSGASAQTPTPQLVCDLRFGETILLKRPENVPGAETDLRWALERAQNRAKQAEAEKERLETYLNTPAFFFWRPY